MKRIIWHWTGGTHRANIIDKDHYHVLVEGGGTVVYGKHKPEANASTADGVYAAHVRAFNTGSIGVAVCAMYGAEGWPRMDPGPYPITDEQVRVLARETANLCETYGIPVTRETVLSHAEVQEVHGVTQRGKWDIRWLPGEPSVLPAKQVGDYLRDLVRDEMGEKPVPDPFPKPAADDLIRLRAQLMTATDTVTAILREIEQ